MSDEYQSIIKSADKFAKQEIEKFGLPSLYNYETSFKKGQEIAIKLNLSKEEKDLVALGTIFMDIKLGQAVSENRLKEHCEMGKQAVIDFFMAYKIPAEVIDTVVDATLHHHGGWKSKVGEICANADCYRFILTKNWLMFLHDLGKRGKPFKEALAYAEQKLEEKWNILSLDICKEELTPHYNNIKEIIKNAKQ